MFEPCSCVTEYIDLRIRGERFTEGFVGVWRRCILGCGQTKMILAEDSRRTLSRAYLVCFVLLIKHNIPIPSTLLHRCLYVVQFDPKHNLLIPDTTVCLFMLVKTKSCINVMDTSPGKSCDCNIWFYQSENIHLRLSVAFSLIPKAIFWSPALQCLFHVHHNKIVLWLLYLVLSIGKD